MPRSRSAAIAWLLLATILLASSGCGFHLRGSGSQVTLAAVLPEVRIEGVDTETGFGRLLEEALTGSGVKVLQKDKADAIVPVLEVGEIREKRQVLSVDRDVRAREYALISKISFRLLQQPDAITDWRAVEARRDLVVDPFQVLGSEQEEKRMRHEMEEELAQRIVLLLRQK